MNGSRLGKKLSANALQEHFAPPAAGIPLPIVLSPQSDMENTPTQSPLYDDAEVGGLGLFSADTQGTDAEEEAFMREMQRRKKKKKKRKI